MISQQVHFKNQRGFTHSFSLIHFVRSKNYFQQFSMKFLSFSLVFTHFSNLNEINRFSFIFNDFSSISKKSQIETQMHLQSHPRKSRMHPKATRENFECTPKPPAKISNAPPRHTHTSENKQNQAMHPPCTPRVKQS